MLRLPPVRRHPRAAAWIGLGFLTLAAAHALVGRASHAEHVVHAVFGAAYLIPIVAASAWLGARAGVRVAFASAAAGLLHVVAGGGEPMFDLQQGVLSAVHVLVGIVTAGLVAAADRERRTWLESERAAQREALVQGLAGLSRALRERHDGTGRHCDHVAAVAEGIAEELGLPAERRAVLRLAALVHDLGKIGVPDDVLLKPGELTPDERARIERHPSVAAEILRPIRGVEEIAEIVRAHHECPDGSGYPRHLGAGAIPPLAAILRVADVYSALLEPRPYKQAMSPAAVLEAMRRLRGKLEAEALTALGRWLVRQGMVAGSGR